MIKMTRTIWTENNTLVIKHNFVIDIALYAREYEQWIQDQFNIKVWMMVDLTKHQISFKINKVIGIDNVAIAFKLEFG